MSAWKNNLVVLIVIFLGVTFLIFLVTGYTALYWAWTRGNLGLALPYLPWARNFGMLAVAGAAVTLGILFSSKTFPVPPRMRLLLSLLATVTIGFFSEFRNEGKFYFKKSPSLFRAWNVESRRTESSHSFARRFSVPDRILALERFPPGSSNRQRSFPRCYRRNL
jgi:hypothetical protein